MNPITIIGYSGHSYVAIDIFESQNQKVTYYCDNNQITNNPFNLKYLGSETEATVFEKLKNQDWFIAIGNNNIRQKIHDTLISKGLQQPTKAIHQKAIIGCKVEINSAVMIGANATINTLATIGTGVICNTGCIIEHECKIGDFAHIAPGAVLAGNVTIGERTFVGANSVIKQGVTVGKDVTIGAGTVIIKDVPDNVTIVGNPGKIIKRPQ